MKLHSIALGCQMSVADAEEMGRPLQARGFQWTGDPEQADVLLINTCTVREHAEQRALSLIGSLKPWKAQDPRRLLIVAGCAAERLRQTLRRRFPHVDLVVGAKSIEQYPQIVEEALGQRFDALAEQRESFPDHDPCLAPSSPVVGYVTIMRGCNYSCSYCIVPSVRGRELYRPVEAILEEIRAKAKAGMREVLLLGQTVNSYAAPYQGRQLRFPELLRLIDAQGHVQRIRFMSPHPYYIDEAFIAAMAEARAVCPFLHLPAQTGSDRVLKLMRRNYSRSSYLAKVARLRSIVPDIVFSTDIIVGFPTETEEEFQESLTLLEELRPASAFCFKYSPRDSTESASWSDDVPAAVKEERLARLNALTARLGAQALNKNVGRRVEVLAEQPRYGRTRDGFKARWRVPVEPGRLCSVRVTGATQKTLLGE